MSHRAESEKEYGDRQQEYEDGRDNIARIDPESLTKLRHHKASLNAGCQLN